MKKQVKKNKWWTISKWILLAITIITIISYLIVWIVYGLKHSWTKNNDIWFIVNDWFFIQTLVLTVIGAVLALIAVYKSNNKKFKIWNTVGWVVEVILAVVGIFFSVWMNADIYPNGKAFYTPTNWYVWLIVDIPLIIGLISFTTEMMSKKLYNKYNKIEMENKKDE